MLTRRMTRHRLAQTAFSPPGEDSLSLHPFRTSRLRVRRLHGSSGCKFHVHILEIRQLGHNTDVPKHLLPEPELRRCFPELIDLLLITYLDQTVVNHKERVSWYIFRKRRECEARHVSTSILVRISSRRKGRECEKKKVS